MPFRKQELSSQCAVCGKPSLELCPDCESPLCADHRVAPKGSYEYFNTKAEIAARPRLLVDPHNCEARCELCSSSISGPCPYCGKMYARSEPGGGPG